MTSPPEEITIACPTCGTLFKTWWRPSMNLMLDPFSPEYIERMSTGTCPHCQTVVRLSALVVDEDGTWR